MGELKEYVDYAIIISTLKARYRKEILAELLDFEGVIYLKTQWIIEGSDVLNFIQNIDLALQRDRKIYLYSKKNLIAGLIEEVLNLYGIQMVLVRKCVGKIISLITGLFLYLYCYGNNLHLLPSTLPLSAA